MLIRRILYWSNFTVIRWQLLFSLLAFLLVKEWAKRNYKDADSAQWEIMSKIVLPLLFYTAFAIFLFSVFTALAAWVFFLVRSQNGKINVQVKFGENEKAEAGLVPLTITMKRALRPLLGSVKARVVFPKFMVSTPVLLDETVYEKGSLVPKGIRGQGKTLLHDRGIFDVQEVDVFFCDMFRLVALPLTFHFNKQLYTLPQELKPKAIKSEPNTTEEQTHRIEIPKRVHGEYLNYKDFESGDDVRRIVWKIYAKNGELVVRIPETMDPYASHLYFYASFYNGMQGEAGGMFDPELLNGYKDKVRNVFEALKKNGYDVRMPYDQESPKLLEVGKKDKDLFHITAASWQKDKAPAEFVDMKKAAFVCISTLTPIDEVHRLLNNLPMNVAVAAVRMSEAIDSPFAMKFKNVFVLPESRPEDKLTGPWLVSSLRSRLQKNEREMLDLFKRRGNAFIIGIDD